MATDFARHDEVKSMLAAITAAGLTKRFGATRALDHLELTVRTGEVHGFLGPNGAGKTTTIRILLGLLHRDGGQVSVLGGDPWHDSVRLHRRPAYVPGEVSLWPNAVHPIEAGTSGCLLLQLHVPYRARHAATA